jgi:hypothetical protein
MCSNTVASLAGTCGTATNTRQASEMTTPNTKAMSPGLEVRRFSEQANELS